MLAAGCLCLALLLGSGGANRPLAAQTPAQTPAQGQLTPAQEAQNYVRQGRYSDAIAPYRQAIHQAEQAQDTAQDTAQLPRLLGNLAIAYRITGQYLQRSPPTSRPLTC
ncbi:MAG: hypothetical protein HC824_14625 [Synechococcales cyanobacterium RM1_1_8]|nr:hypothetical protein [Synechococcales cyanobacterium RM1_1_8]